MYRLRRLIPLIADDTACLYKGDPVSSMVINGYLRIVERRSIFYPSLPKVWVFDTTFLQDWERGGYEATKRSVPENIDLLSMDLLLFPLHLDSITNGPWALVVVKPTDLEVQAYDSLGRLRGKELNIVLKYLSAYIESRGMEFHVEQWKRTETPPTCPRQTDSVSCGVYVCAYAEVISRKMKIEEKPICTKTARKTIASVLRRGRFDNEDFSLIEPTDWRASSRFSGVATENQPIMFIDVCTPDGRLERMETAYDPLLEELNEAIDHGYSRSFDDLFPPLIKTTKNMRLDDGIEEITTSSDIKAEKYPINAGESEDKSPCLSISASDLDYEWVDVSIVSDTYSSATVQAQLANLDDIPETPNNDQQVKQSAEESTPTQLRDQPPSHQNIPYALKERIMERERFWTPKQARDQKWKVFQEDGTFYRMRSKKLKRLWRTN